VASEARQRPANRYDLSVPENQRKLDAADVMLDAAVLDHIDEIVPPRINLNPPTAAAGLPRCRFYSPATPNSVDSTGSLRPRGSRRP
jgi:hypothetical protein